MAGALKHLHLHPPVSGASKQVSLEKTWTPKCAAMRTIVQVALLVCPFTHVTTLCSPPVAVLVKPHAYIQSPTHSTRQFVCNCKFCGRGNRTGETDTACDKRDRPDPPSCGGKDMGVPYMGIHRIDCCPICGAYMQKRKKMRWAQRRTDPKRPQ